MKESPFHCPQTVGTKVLEVYMGGLVLTLALVECSACLCPMLDRSIIAGLAAPQPGPGRGSGGVVV